MSRPTRHATRKPTPRSMRKRTPRRTRASTLAPIVVGTATRMPTRPRTERRTTMRTLMTAAALSLAAFATAAAQDFNWHGRIATGKRLEVKGVNGDVRAVLASGAEALVHARKHGRRSDPDDVEIRVVESEEGVTICAVYPTPARAREENNCELCVRGHSNTENNDVVVDFEVQVPAGVEFNGKTVNGEMSAEGLKGDARVSTVNGSVTLIMPGGKLDTEVRAITVNGDIESDWPMTITGRFNNRRLHGTIGAGGRELSLSTVNGEIRLKKSME